jgi:hypothetical protein
MRAVFIATFLANILLALLSLAILPDRVAIHFGLGGAADSWAASLTNTLFMLLVGALTTRANLSDPVSLDENALLIGLGGFFAYTAYWTIGLLRAFRVPEKR